MHMGGGLRMRHRSLGVAIGVAFAVATISSTVMEIVDNLIIVVIPGAMDAGLTSWLFWGSLTVARASGLPGDGAHQSPTDPPRQRPHRRHHHHRRSAGEPAGWLC
jgi:hypothetical protein